MIVRHEISGIHFYDRNSGCHCLVDEVVVSNDEALRCGPRHLSVQITDRCNLNCDYCYAVTGSNVISIDLLKSICDAARELSVFDITIGGGEPTLHPLFVDIVNFIWDEYSFGISITTNGADLEPIRKLGKKNIQVRFSLDSQKKNRTLDEVQVAFEAVSSGNIAVNLLYRPGSSDWVEKELEMLSHTPLENILIIPEHVSGEYKLSDSDWKHISKILKESDRFQFCLTGDAISHVTAPILETASSEEFLFAQIDFDGAIRERSWQTMASRGTTTTEICSALLNLHPLRRKYEVLV